MGPMGLFDPLISESGRGKKNTIRRRINYLKEKTREQKEKKRKKLK